MKKHISYPKIKQFRDVVASVTRNYNFIGLDDKGQAIYDSSLPKPTLKFKGTVKLHGTNAGVSYNHNDGIWAQSRENIITPQSDNAGFAFFVENNREVFINLIEQVAKWENLDLNLYTLTIYGEWCGGSIQKGVGICNITKSFFIFGVKVSNLVEEGFGAYWVDSAYLSSAENRIYSINDYPTYEIEIDFNQPQLSQNNIIELTENVEKECPVSKEFGFPNTIGEGIVFSCGEYRFKSKGLLHAGKSKVKVLNKVDDVRLQTIMDVAQEVTPEWRLSQMLEKSCNLLNGGYVERKYLGDYIRMVINDVIEEDGDIIAANDLEPKDVNKAISEIARKYFFEAEKI